MGNTAFPILDKVDGILEWSNYLHIAKLDLREFSDILKTTKEYQGSELSLKVIFEIWLNCHATITPSPETFSLSPVNIIRMSRVHRGQGFSTEGYVYFVVYCRELFEYFKQEEQFKPRDDQRYEVAREMILPFTRAPLF